MKNWKWAVVLLATMTIGCGGGASDKPQLTAVTGRLVSPKGDPVADAQIEFQPAKGAPSSAVTGPDGSFTLSYADGSKGAIIGAHQVRVTIGTNAMGDGGDSAAPTKRQAPKPPTLYILPQQVQVEAQTPPLELRLPEKGTVG